VEKKKNQLRILEAVLHRHRIPFSKKHFFNYTFSLLLFFSFHFHLKSFELQDDREKREFQFVCERKREKVGK